MFCGTSPFRSVFSVSEPTSSSILRLEHASRFIFRNATAPFRAADTPSAKPTRIVQIGESECRRKGAMMMGRLAFMEKKKHMDEIG